MTSMFCKGIFMIGIVIGTHSTFAQGLKASSEMVAGPQENLDALCFMGDVDLMELGNQMKELGDKYEDGCIYVVDLQNATPFNAALLAIAGSENVVLSGASLPMMLELLTLRNGWEGTCEELAKEIKDSCAGYVDIKHARDVF